MKCSRGVPVVLALIVAVVLGSAGGLIPCAHAETVDRLRPEIITAETLTTEQRQQITQYVEGWADALQSDDIQRVMEARQRLLEPMRAGRPSDAFRNEYSSQAAERLRPALDDDHPAVRMNAMVVATRLRAQDAMPLIERTLDDENAAVRYWSVKAIQTVSFSGNQAQRLIGPLVNHVENEPEMQVVEQALLALVGLDTDEARLRGLAMLNDRVDRHLAEPGQSLQAEHSGLQRVYHQLAGTATPDSDALRQLARASIRYQDLASRRLGNDEVPREARDSYGRMLQLCNAALRFVSNSLEVENVPASIDPMISRGDWAGIQRNADQWRTLLENAPFNLSANDLAVGEE